MITMRPHEKEIFETLCKPYGCYIKTVELRRLLTFCGMLDGGFEAIAHFTGYEPEPLKRMANTTKNTNVSTVDRAKFTRLHVYLHCRLYGFFISFFKIFNPEIYEEVKGRLRNPYKMYDPDVVNEYMDYTYIDPKEEHKLSKKKNCYVYAVVVRDNTQHDFTKLRDIYPESKLKFDGTPIYIGEGIRGRCKDHLKIDKEALTYVQQAIKEYQDRGVKVDVIKLFTKITKTHALEIEADFISFIKRIPDGGTLLNISAGGKIAFKASRSIRYIDNSGKNNAFYGKKHTQQTIQSIQDSRNQTIKDNTPKEKLEVVK